MKSRKIFINALVYLVVVLAAMVTAAVAQNDLRQPQKEQLLNGLKVLMWPDTKADKVWLRVRVHAGSAFDPQGKEGVMQLLADNMFPGPTARDFFVEDLGGSLDVVTTYDYIQITASLKPEAEAGKADRVVTALETLSTALINPPIDRATTANLRNALLTRVNELQDDPAYLADQAVSKRLLGTFPYGRPQFGTQESLQKVDFVDLLDAKQRFLTADNATLAVSGNFDRALAFRAIRRYFGAWLKADKKVPTTFKQPDTPPKGVLSITSPKPDAAALRFALRGSARADKDFAASQVLTAVVAVRLKSSVQTANSGDVNVSNDAHVLPGVIKVSFAISGKDHGGKDGVGDLVLKALSDPITETEFRSAKAAILSDRSKRPQEDLWLDMDTYKIDIAAERAAFESLALADLNAYAEKMRKEPIVSVIVNTPAK